MINDVKFSEEIENIARIFFRNITCDVELLEIKFEFYSEKGDFHLATHAENKSKNIQNKEAIKIGFFKKSKQI